MKPKFVFEYIELPGKSKEDIIRDLSKLSKDELNNKLLSASYEGATSVIQYLIDAGANVNYKNEYGNTPLILASGNAYTNIVKILIDNGVDVNAKDNYGNTPLMFAIQKGNKDIVKILINNGADVNTKTIYGNTPLIIASGFKDIVELLKKHRAKE